eukprot:TRINITY_DN6231_c2_g1_i1.p1 TRINITY_DN6231_c2_g1~~TRINITY_DN6231_c2_g1_i1.p1  ORF type:complete len:660 (+),score=117.25 TRINITY_DN6231_c2_g1_i1:90-2069(+)
MGCGASNGDSSKDREASKTLSPDPKDDSDDDDDSFIAMSPKPRRKLDKMEKLDIYREGVRRTNDPRSPHSPGGKQIDDDVFLLATLAIDNSPCAALVASEEGCVVSINASLLDLLGLTMRELADETLVTTLFRLPAATFGDPPTLRPVSQSAGALSATATPPERPEFPVLLRGVELPFGDGGGYVCFVDKPQQLSPTPSRRQSLADSAVGRVQRAQRPSQTSRPRQSIKNGNSPIWSPIGDSLPDMAGVRQFASPTNRRASELSAPSSLASSNTNASGAQLRPARLWPHGDVSFTIDPNGVIQAASHGALRLLHLLPADAKGKDLDTILAPSEDGRSLKALVLDGEAALLRGEEDRLFVVKTAKDTTEQVLVSSICEAVAADAAQQGDEYDTVQWYCVRVLVLESAKAHQKRGLLQALQKCAVTDEITAVYDGYASAVVITSDNGEVLHCNEPATKLFEFDLDALRGENVSVLVPYPWRVSHAERVRLAFLAGSSGVLRGARAVPMITRTGRIVPVKIEISQLATPRGQYLFVACLQHVPDVAALASTGGKFAKLPNLMESCAADPRNEEAGTLSRNSSAARRGDPKRYSSLRSLRSLRRLELVKNSAASLGSKRSLRSPKRMDTSPRDSKESRSSGGSGPGSPSGSGSITRVDSPRSR